MSTTIQNLDQIRAYNAITAQGSWKGENDGEVVKKVPAMIRANGLLGAAAFAVEKGSGHADVFKAIVKHLSHPDVKKIPKDITWDNFIEFISGPNSDSARLRSITDESLAYLNYLRRFAKKSDGAEGGE